jgi:hypothetical protein
MKIDNIRDFLDNTNELLLANYNQYIMNHNELSLDEQTIILRFVRTVMNNNDYQKWLRESKESKMPNSIDYKVG